MRMFSDSSDYEIIDPTSAYRQNIQKQANNESNPDVKAGLLKALEIIDDIRSKW